MQNAAKVVAASLWKKKWSLVLKYCFEAFCHGASRYYSCLTSFFRFVKIVEANYHMLPPYYLFSSVQMERLKSEIICVQDL